MAARMLMPKYLFAWPRSQATQVREVLYLSWPGNVATVCLYPYIDALVYTSISGLCVQRV